MGLGGGNAGTWRLLGWGPVYYRVCTGMGYYLPDSKCRMSHATCLMPGVLMSDVLLGLILVQSATARLFGSVRRSKALLRESKLFAPVRRLCHGSIYCISD